MGDKLGYSNKERLVYREKKRERSQVFTAVSGSEKVIGEREIELSGVERWLK